MDLKTKMTQKIQVLRNNFSFLSKKHQSGCFISVVFLAILQDSSHYFLFIIWQPIMILKRHLLFFWLQNIMVSLFLPFSKLLAHQLVHTSRLKTSFEINKFSWSPAEICQFMMNTSLAYLMKKAKTVGDPGLVTRPSTVMSSTKLMVFAHWEELSQSVSDFIFSNHYGCSPRGVKRSEIL